MESPDTLYESCIGKIAGGDRDALGVLYEGTKSIVYGFALSIVRNTEDAEDVLQDTFVNIFTSAANYKKMGKPLAWILTIAKNLSLMKARNRKKTADITEDEWNRMPADAPSVTVEDSLVLQAAMKKITPEESRIVMLHAVAGLKHREIAQILDLPLSTVLSKFNRAIKKLKNILEENDM